MTHSTFTVHPSPVGDVLLVTTDAGLVCTEVLPDDDDRGIDQQLAALSRTLGETPGRDDAGADGARRQLDEYFDGRRRAFDLVLDWRLVAGFARDALQQVCEIPYGQTAGYGEVAIMAGHAGAARAVGNACARSPFSIVVPVHRVVHADGSIGGYGSRIEVKRYLLDLERTDGE
ncbi:methylated-DNA--[protein]-cysteine S-methyltransferase [Microbacterium sp.]|uniref:methylated-DNA--[protein]-cysteine S-methyltransferase n=1 Tax=Microbacterium sp. TaxID=51671 RepID=UPI003A8F338E